MAIEIERLRTINVALLDALSSLMDFHNEGRIPTPAAITRAEIAIAEATEATP